MATRLWNSSRLNYENKSREKLNRITCFYAYSYFIELEDSASLPDHEQSQSMELIVRYIRMRHAPDPRDKIIALYIIS